MPRALVFLNAKASQAAGCFEEVAGCLGKAGIEVERGEADCEAGYAERLRKLEAPVDMLVAGGGDGTVRCAAEAILAETGGKLPLGIIPLGTANNVARSLGLPRQVAGACAVIAAGKTAPMDLARVNGRIFVSVAGIGLSTKVHDEVPAELKKRWGSLAYAWYALKLLLLRPPAFHVEIRSDEGVQRVKALQITVCNGKYYGAHVEVHPDASLSEGALDLSVVEAGKYVRGFLKALLPIRVARRSPGLRLLHGRRFELRTKPLMTIDVEGATDLRTPATFEVLPHALQVFAP